MNDVILSALCASSVFLLAASLGVVCCARKSFPKPGQVGGVADLAGSLSAPEEVSGVSDTRPSSSARNRGHNHNQFARSVENSRKVGRQSVRFQY